MEFCNVETLNPCAVSRTPFRDTLQAHPCGLGFGRPWPQTVPERRTGNYPLTKAENFIAAFFSFRTFSFIVIKVLGVGGLSQDRLRAWMAWPDISEAERRMDASFRVSCESPPTPRTEFVPLNEDTP